MRSTWKGHIQMALISIPVKLGGAVGKNDLDLHMYRKSDGSRIQFKKVAATDGTEVTMGEIVKGYETGDGSAVLFDDAELDDHVLRQAQPAHDHHGHGLANAVVGGQVVDLLQLGRR